MRTMTAHHGVVVCHIADFEPVLVERMKRIIALGDTPLLLAADENLFIKAHGRSGPRALANAIRVADKAQRADVCGAISSGLAGFESRTRAQPSATSA